MASMRVKGNKLEEEVRGMRNVKDRALAEALEAKVRVGGGATKKFLQSRDANGGGGQDCAPVHENSFIQVN